MPPIISLVSNHIHLLSDSDLQHLNKNTKMSQHIYYNADNTARLHTSVTDPTTCDQFEGPTITEVIVITEVIKLTLPDPIFVKARMIECARAGVLLAKCFDQTYLLSQRGLIDNLVSAL